MANWFTNPASNTMLDNSFRNQFFQNQVRPVQTGATNIRPTNLQALKNWAPWKTVLPKSWGGTWHTGPTAGASGALGMGTAAALPLGVAGLTHMVQRGLPEELKGEGGLFDTSTAAWGGMGAGAGIDPETDEILRANAIFSGDRPVEEQVTETENIDPRGMRGISGEVGEYGDKPGEGFNEEMFYQEPGMWDKFKGMFQRPEAKQKEFEAYEASMNPQGWGDFGDYKGRIDDRGKIDIGDPVTGQMILRDKNFDSAFGSGSVQEMIDKKDAWITDRLLSGKKISKALTSYAMNKGLGTFGDQGGMGAGKPRGDPSGYSGPRTYNFNPSIKGTQAFHPSQGTVSTSGFQQGSQHQDIPHGTNTSGNFAGKGSGNPFGRAHGGYMRSGYNEGGRVGILAAF